MHRHDVAIFAPDAMRLYRPGTPSAGGAERQAYLVAKSLARLGFRVAHIVHPIEAPVLDPGAPVTLVGYPKLPSHSPYALTRGAMRLWRTLSHADARIQIFYGGSPRLAVAAAWCRAHRRRLVFCVQHNSELTPDRFAASDPRRFPYEIGLRATDVVIAQSQDQVALAGRHHPRLRRLELIENLVEPAALSDEPAEAFLWVSRLHDDKDPLLYPRLAASVPEAKFWMITSHSLDPGVGRRRAELERLASTTPNLELLPWRPHGELMKLFDRAVAIVNTSRVEGMPTTFLEGWARGIPALTLNFDPDERIAKHRLGVSAGGSWDAFVAGARAMWAARRDRGGYGPIVRAHVEAVHGDEVTRRWADLVTDLRSR